MFVIPFHINLSVSLIELKHPLEVSNKRTQTALSTLRKKCPNMEFFLVRIFPHLDQKKLRIWTLFTQSIYFLN